MQQFPNSDHAAIGALSHNSSLSSSSEPPCTRTAGTASCQSLETVTMAEPRRLVAGPVGTSARNRSYSSQMLVSTITLQLQVIDDLLCLGAEQYRRDAGGCSGRIREHERPSRTHITSSSRLILRLLRCCQGGASQRLSAQAAAEG